MLSGKFNQCAAPCLNFYLFIQNLDRPRDRRDICFFSLTSLPLSFLPLVRFQSLNVALLASFQSVATLPLASFRSLNVGLLESFPSVVTLPLTSFPLWWLYRCRVFSWLLFRSWLFRMWQLYGWRVFHSRVFPIVSCLYTFNSLRLYIFINWRRKWLYL